MKTKIFLAVVTVAAAIALFNYESDAKEHFVLTLDNVEAHANCEVSPNPSENKGYCQYKFGTKIGVCTDTGDPASPRCSGNIE